MGRDYTTTIIEIQEEIKSAIGTTGATNEPPHTITASIIPIIRDGGKVEEVAGVEVEIIVEEVEEVILVKEVIFNIARDQEVTSRIVIDDRITNLVYKTILASLCEDLYANSLLPTA